MVKQIPVRKLSFLHPFPDIQKNRRIVPGKHVVSGKKAEQSCRREGNTDADAHRCQEMFSSVQCFLRPVRGTQQPEKLEGGNRKTEEPKSQIAAVQSHAVHLLPFLLI